MRVKLLVAREGPRPMVAGRVYDLSDEEAGRLIARGKAEKADKGETETAMQAPSTARKKKSVSKKKSSTGNASG